MKEALSPLEIRLNTLKGGKFLIFVTPYTLEFWDFDETLYYHLVLIHVTYPKYKAHFKFYY